MQRDRPTKEVNTTLVKHRLGELLVEAGVIDRAQLQEALFYQRKSGCRLGQALTRLSLASEAQVVRALSRKLKCPRYDLAAALRSPPSESTLKLVPAELALREKVLPVSASETCMTLVMADPSNVALVSELSLSTGRRVDVAIAGESEIVAAVSHLYSSESTSRSAPTRDGRATKSAQVPPLPTDTPTWFASPVDDEPSPGISRSTAGGRRTPRR